MLPAGEDFCFMMNTTIVKKIISTAVCPRPVGPYNQAVIVDRTVYLSGVVGLDKDTSKLVPGGVVPETIQTLKNIENLLRVTGSKIDNVIKCTVLLSDINDFAAVNQEYTKGSSRVDFMQFSNLSNWFISSLYVELPGENLLPSRKPSDRRCHRDRSYCHRRRCQSGNGECRSQVVNLSIKFNFWGFPCANLFTFAFCLGAVRSGAKRFVRNSWLVRVFGSNDWWRAGDMNYSRNYINTAAKCLPWFIARARLPSLTPF